jgi:hypothetical protein
LSTSIGTEIYTVELHRPLIQIPLVS